MRIDTSKALAMPGVKGILTADELPAPADVVTDLGQRIPANTKGERALTNEPLYQGEPVRRGRGGRRAHGRPNAIEKIEIELGTCCRSSSIRSSASGPTDRTRGSKAISGDGRSRRRQASRRRRPAIEDAEMDGRRFRRLRPGPAADGQDAGRVDATAIVDAGFKNAALVLDETFVTPNTSHQTLEPRTAMAYWQNGKLYIHCSTQSVVQTVGSMSRWLHLDQKDVVLISEYTGRRLRQQGDRHDHVDDPGAACRRS